MSKEESKNGLRLRKEITGSNVLVIGAPNKLLKVYWASKKDKERSMMTRRKKLSN
jgi:hypothetical protein